MTGAPKSRRMSGELSGENRPDAPNWRSYATPQRTPCYSALLWTEQLDPNPPNEKAAGICISKAGRSDDLRPESRWTSGESSSDLPAWLRAGMLSVEG